MRLRERVLAFVDSLYVTEEFLSDFNRLQKKIGTSALSLPFATVLKITSPVSPISIRVRSVDLSLADPDNRRLWILRRIQMFEELQKRARPGIAEELD